MARLQISLRIPPELVRKAQKVLGVRSKTEVVERALAALVELDKHRRLIRRFSGTARPDDFRDR